MREFIALRAKSYKYILEDREKIKAKGIQEHVVKNHMTFKNHFADDEEDKFNLYTENISIRSFNHEIRTIKSNKLIFNRQDDKRVAQAYRIHTYAYGHFKTDYKLCIKIDLQISKPNLPLFAINLLNIGTGLK